MIEVGRAVAVVALVVAVAATACGSVTAAERGLVAAYSFEEIALRPGDSLVSSISVDEVGRTRRWLFDRACIWRAHRGG